MESGINNINPGHRRIVNNRSEIAVVIPVYRSEPDEYEKISLSQCLQVLNSYKIIIITYRSLDVSRYLEYLEQMNQPVPELVYFAKRNFNSIQGYSRLLLSLRFYLRFIRYRYILIYQLDAFVFRDELREWASRDYSYVGAPWLLDWKKATVTDQVVGAGNGGFSLRRVRSHIRALLTFSYIENPQGPAKKIIQQGCFLIEELGILCDESYCKKQHLLSVQQLCGK